jgi:hypothetical protein
MKRSNHDCVKGQARQALTHLNKLTHNLGTYVQCVDLGPPLKSFMHVEDLKENFCLGNVITRLYIFYYIQLNVYLLDCQ